MAQCTFHRGHQLAVTPVRADREEGHEVLPVVEEVPQPRRRESRRRVVCADDADEQVVVDDGVAGRVRPVAITVLVAAGEGVGSDAVGGGVVVGAEGELDECEGQRAAIGEAGSDEFLIGSGEVRANVQRVRDVGGFEAFLSGLGAEVEFCTGEAEKVTGEVFVHVH